MDSSMRVWSGTANATAGLFSLLKCLTLSARTPRAMEIQQKCAVAKLLVYPSGKIPHILPPLPTLLRLIRRLAAIRSRAPIVQ
jgi:hypothetical protein